MLRDRRLRASIRCAFPSICSGDMYAGVPLKPPSSDERTCSAIAVRARRRYSSGSDTRSAFASSSVIPFGT